jgi:hypothetical protein
MQIRNPIYTATGNIDCEIEHPQFGWIPFTASPDDAEEHGRAIYAAALEMNPAPYVAAPLPAPNQADFTAAIRNHVDAVAQAKNYDNAWSLAGYVSSTIPEWAEQAQVFVAWRDQVWSFALAEFAEIQAGTKPVPTIAELVASLPEIEWPE